MIWCLVIKENVHFSEIPADTFMSEMIQSIAGICKKKNRFKKGKIHKRINEANVKNKTSLLSGMFEILYQIKKIEIIEYMS